MKIVMLGAPGSGKGTLANGLVEKYKIPKISTGDIFRDQIEKQTELGKEVNVYIAQGQLVPDELTIKILQDRLKDCEKGFILDGFPRTLEQAKALEKISKINFVLNLRVSLKTIVKRLSARRTCEKCKSIYNLETVPPKKEGICDKCKGKLFQREDDTPNIIQKRFDTYKEKTEPLIDHYQNEGMLANLNADTTPEDVLKEATEVLEA